jgi:hypothetical protein
MAGPGLDVDPQCLGHRRHRATWRDNLRLQPPAAIQMLADNQRGVPLEEAVENRAGPSFDDAVAHRRRAAERPRLPRESDGRGR